MTRRQPRPAAQNMGRPPKKETEKKTRTSLAIDRETLADLRAIAKDEYRSLSSLIEAIASNYVKLYKSNNKKVDSRTQKS